MSQVLERAASLVVRPLLLIKVSSIPLEKRYRPYALIRRELSHVTFAEKGDLQE